MADDTSTATLDITPTGQACGAFVRGVDLSQPLTDADVAAIRAAWLDHKVLVFPEQPMTEADQERFTLYFGPFGHEPFFEPIDGHPHIAAIHRLADETSTLFAENWHTDWSFQEFPPDGTILCSRVVPPRGGDTLYADQQKAWETMPSELKERLADKVAVHSARGGYAPDGTYGEKDAAGRSMRIVFDDSAYETQTHPLVRPHRETGAAAVYSTLGYIIDLCDTDGDEARDLLRELSAWQTRDEFVYRHSWEPDMLVMWDNRVLLHRATGGFDGYERLLHRTTVGYNSRF